MELLECPWCIDGTEYEHTPYGDFESECHACNGTGMLDELQSDNLRRFREAYQKMKEAEEN